MGTRARENSVVARGSGPVENDMGVLLFLCLSLLPPLPACLLVPAPADRTAIAVEPRAHYLRCLQKKLQGSLLRRLRHLRETRSSFLLDLCNDPRDPRLALLRHGAPILPRSRKPHPRHHTDVVPRIVTCNLGQQNNKRSAGPRTLTSPRALTRVRGGIPTSPTGCRVDSPLPLLR